MSINKKTLLGKQPVELGVKDAVHAAIVSLRSGVALAPGEHITLNSDREAIKASHKDSFGIVDPFLDGPVARGTMFWCMVKMEEIESVQHQWDHPKFSFEAPTKEPTRNMHLERHAASLGITYDALMMACHSKAIDEKDTEYSGPLNRIDFDEVIEGDGDDLWYEWSDESGHEFDNNGTECCPEYGFPDSPFKFVAATEAV